MPKTTLDVVGRGYRSIDRGQRCPSCFRNNTYFSCWESACVCFDCGEIFEVSVSPIVFTPNVRRSIHIQRPDNTETITADFTDLRSRLKS